MSVAVVVTPQQDAERLVRWAALLGRALATDVLILDVTERPGETEESEEAGRRVAAAVKRVQEGLENAPETACAAVAHEDAVRAVLEQVRKHEVALLILGQQLKSKPDTAMLSLFRDAPCPTLLLRPGGDRAEEGAHVLVPVSRGPHAQHALQLGAALASAADGRVTALYVQTGAGEDADLLGARILERRITRALPGGSANVDLRVERGEKVRETVSGVAEGHDIVLAGAPDEWTARRVLFGTLQRADFYGPEGTSVGVVRGSAPLPKRMGTALRRLVEARIPQMDRVERVALADNLQSASRFSFDFVFLVCVSTLIATLGLVDDSTAVVIGAMLLAPLMTPLIGAGAAIVQGNPRFLMTTLRSVSFGFLLALGIGWLVGDAARPEEVLTIRELAARDSPQLLDLAVAFFSGVAAAYATARPGLSAALPGVAIAASLVPPLATGGIMLSSGYPWRATGAILLFTTNIVAIILGASLSLYATGIRRRHLHGRQGQVVSWVAVLALVLAAAVVIWGGFLVAEVIRGR
jgi:uncharacterized hydrophobic protein (TIGR00271 family)